MAKSSAIQYDNSTRVDSLSCENESVVKYGRRGEYVARFGALEMTHAGHRQLERAWYFLVRRQNGINVVVAHETDCYSEMLMDLSNAFQAFRSSRVDYICGACCPVYKDGNGDEAMNQ